MSKIKTAKDPIDNVVVFPKTKDGAPPQTVEELRKKIAISRLEVAALLAEELTKENLRIMFDNGYNITNTKDIAFLLIVLKSILLRHEDIEYPVQDLIDEHVDYLSTEDDDT